MNENYEGKTQTKPDFSWSIGTRTCEQYLNELGIGMDNSDHSGWTANMKSAEDILESSGYQILDIR
ncbi:hypothetical protein HQ545_00550 [Candidatus Woesearchaeota archaeon]|nr:hypothetical protein [Candidatus Woesearchaeota archaeon]